MTNNKPVDKLTRNQTIVLNFLKKNPTVSYEEAAAGTKLHKGSVQRAIKALRTKNLLARQKPTWILL